MRYQTLGNSGLRVSELCLGTMTFGDVLGWLATACAAPCTAGCAARSTVRASHGELTARSGAEATDGGEQPE